MPSTYTLNNGIELVATGEQSGTWGDTTNTNFTLLDTSLDGQVTVTLGATGSSGSPNALPVSDGATSNGRNRLIIFADSGDLGGTAFVQLTPNDAEKIIYVRNNLSGSRSILLFQGTYNASNDYEVPAGTTAVVFFNGAGSGAVAANVFNNAHFDAMNVVGGVTITTADNTAQLTLISTDADAGIGPHQVYYRNSSSPADNDLLAEIDHRGRNDNSQDVDYVTVNIFAEDVSDGTEDGRYLLQTKKAGATVSRIDTTSTETVFNDDSVDLDFRVESNGIANMLFVDAAEDKVFIGHGTTHQYDAFGAEIIMQIEAAGTAPYAGIGMVQNSNDADIGPLIFGKSRGTSLGSTTIVQDGDLLGRIEFQGMDGSDLETGASIFAAVDGTPGSNDMPGRLVFLTTADGNSSPTERMRISSTGATTITGANTLTLRNDTGTDANEPKLTFDNDTFSGANYANLRTGNGGLILYIESPSTSTFQNRHQLLLNGGGGDDFQYNLSTDNGSNYVNYFKIDGGNPIFNESGADKDFRVEGDGEASLFFVDGSKDRIGIGTQGLASGASGSGDNHGILMVRDNTYPVASFQRNAVSQTTGSFTAMVLNTETTGTPASGLASGMRYLVDGSIVAETAGFNNGTYHMRTCAAGGSLVEKLALGTTTAVFNEDSGNIDFRVESNAKTHMLFVDAGTDAIGINNSTPNTYPANTQTGTATDGGQFRVGGSVGAVCVGDTGNEIAFTRSGLNYISSPNGGFNIRAGTSGGVSLGVGGTSFSSASDERLKTLTGDIENAIDKVKTLRTKMGRYNDDSQKISHPFLIAQDVQAVLPEAVNVIENDPNVEDKTGVTDKLYLNYTDVIPLLTAALKESIAKNEALEARVAALES